VYVPSIYYIVSGLGYLILSVVIFGLMILAAKAMNQIMRTLKLGEEMKIAVSSNQVISSESNNNVANTGGAQLNRSQLKLLRRKFMVFLITCLLGGTYTLVVGSAYYAGQLGEPWKMIFEPQANILLVIGRCIYCVIVFTCIFVFNVPRSMISLNINSTEPMRKPAENVEVKLHTKNAPQNGILANAKVTDTDIEDGQSGNRVGGTGTSQHTQNELKENF
jgi:hypothetical protein